LPGRRVRTTAQRPWIEWAYARSDRFPPRGVTPLTPIMGRATDPGENHDPGKDQRFTPSLTQEPRLENPGENHDPGKDQRFTPSLTQEPRLENSLGQDRKLPTADMGDHLAPKPVIELRFRTWL
jgi:hypothetical protein